LKEIGEPILENHKNYQKNFKLLKDDKEKQLEFMRYANGLNRKLAAYASSKQASKKIVGNRMVVAHKSYYTFVFDI
jgi:hypothetical protein